MTGWNNQIMNETCYKTSLLLLLCVFVRMFPTGVDVIDVSDVLVLEDEGEFI